MPVDDYKVNVIDYKHVPILGPRNELITKTRVSITVGSYGPFSKDFTPPQDTSEDINAWKLQQVQNVRNLLNTL